MIEQKLLDLLEQKFQEEEFTSFFLIELKIHLGSKIEVFIDGDNGVTFVTCRRISRYLEHHIDENGWLGEQYSIDVSSPGTSKPLVFKRQYPKHLGRKLEVKLLADGKKVGKLITIEENHIVLEEKTRIKEGKKKKTVILKHEIAFDDIKTTIVKISFSK